MNLVHALPKITKRSGVTFFLLMLVSGTLPKTSFSPGYDSVLGYNYANNPNVASIYRSIYTPPVENYTTHNAKSVLGSFSLIGPELPDPPVNVDGSIVIPTIGVNSPIVFDVPVRDTEQYRIALEQGVAHAKGTDKPSEKPSNAYFFAHSTFDERYIAQYAAVFTKLNQLSVGKDVISVFFEGQRYDYQVIDKEIVPQFEVSVLSRKYDYPAITLQTCYPPGQDKDRLIVTGKLVGKYDR